PGEPLATTLAALRITHAMLPPVALAATEPSPHTHGTTLISGGEALTAAQVERWSPNHQLFNAYGPTESTVAVTFSNSLTEPVTPPIGTPNINTRIYVLDEHLNPVPPNTPGELYTTGPGLARGYLGRPALTAERFTANPYGQPGTRLYRTGDLARWTTDGQLHHLGRADDQIKIRGFRIELGEIETTLTRHPHITQATVIVREDQPGNPQLTAYIQPHPGTNPTSAELRHHTQQALPHYMIPAHIVILDELPLTPNGKINRKALPAPVHTTQATTLPRTPHEEIIAGIITDLLQLPTINTTDNFFDLGGHSLLATRLITRINTTLTTNLTIRDLFDNPTTTQLAHLVDNSESHVNRPQLTTYTRPEHLPLSHAQQRLWLLDQIEGPTPTYNIPLAIRLTGELDTHALTQAVNDLINRHEPLRTTYRDHQGTPYQHIHPTQPHHLTLIQSTEHDLTTHAAQPFDLSTELPIRAALFSESGTTHTLLLTLHHIAADGWSLAPLISDLIAHYRARVEGSAAELPPLPVQYGDYVLWQSELLGDPQDPGSEHYRQLAHWTKTLDALP
ncbi:condensation domain-containing protein, partial [Kitasatospora sp. NPDC094011]|uniref:condensation domain-containing protein n=1 Tax=Kitasatospora sp. NPDC094011 TaxID=3364090 RepID=UPI00381E7532